MTQTPKHVSAKPQDVKVGHGPLLVGQRRKSGDCSVERLPDTFRVVGGHGPVYRVRTGWGDTWCAHSEHEAWADLRDAVVARGYIGSMPARILCEQLDARRAATTGALQPGGA